jgi:hypothetical protein
MVIQTYSVRFLGPYRMVLYLIVTLESGTRSWLYPVFCTGSVTMLSGLSHIH